MQSTLINSSSFHPTLSLTLPPTLLTSPSTSGCTPHILVHLPPGIFYDPFTASNPIITQGRSPRGYNVSHLANEAELEDAVGYSIRKGKGKEDQQWWEKKETGFVEERETEEESRVQGLIQEAALEKVSEVTGGNVGEQHLGKRRKVVKKDQRGSEEEMGGKKEVSTLVIEVVDVDELLRADGKVKVEVALHLRYQSPTKQSAAKRMQGGALAAIHSPYTRLLKDILPIASIKRAKQTVIGLFTISNSTIPYSSISPTTSSTSQYVETCINPTPALFLTCTNHHSSSNGGATKFVEGFYSTSLSSLFPRRHLHLLNSAAFSSSSLGKNSQGLVLALSQTKVNQPQGGLKVKVPVLDATLLAPVQITTLVTVFGAAAGVVYYLFSSVVPSLEAVEKTL
ncbi:hypothetical protein NDA18_001597 [Ustilago nuda]|nr:hypothetical protein NDA18_001597 [Ustilago nuda]